MRLDNMFLVEGVVGFEKGGGLVVVVVVVVVFGGGVFFDNFIEYLDYRSKFV